MNYVLLVTGTVYPDVNMPYLCIKNSEERLKQYKESLLWFIKKTKVSHIVFCDNSLCPYEEFKEISEQAVFEGKQFEYLTFAANNDMMLKRGKGFGEGEIIQYVLKNSHLIKNEDYFVKVTGRLKIKNIDKIIKSLCPNTFYINMFNKERVDTRIYAIPKSMYIHHFENIYKKVNDKKGYYLEHVFTDVIQSETIYCKNFRFYPQIIGVSGSTGKIYDTNILKSFLKDCMSLINYYGYKNRG